MSDRITEIERRIAQKKEDILRKCANSNSNFESIFTQNLDEESIENRQKELEEYVNDAASRIDKESLSICNKNTYINDEEIRLLEIEIVLGAEHNKVKQTITYKDFLKEKINDLKKESLIDFRLIKHLESLIQ